MALTIPTINKNNFELLEDNMELIADKLSDQQKAQIAQFKYEKRQGEEEKKLREVLFQANHPKLAKARDLVTKGWEKLMKGQWFKKVGGFLRGMVNSAGGWLRNLLAIITLLNSGILQEMLPWLFQVGATAIQVLIKWTPTILKFIWQMLTRMIPQLLKGIFNTVFDALGLPDDHPIRKFFNYIFDNFPKFADWLLKTFKDMFILIGDLGKNLYDTLKPVIEWAKQGDNFKKIAIVSGIVAGIVGALLLLAKLGAIAGVIGAFFANVAAGASVVAGIFTSIGGVLSTIAGTIGGIVAAIGGVVASIGLIPVLIVAGIVAVGVAIFVFRKQIAEFFTKTLPKWWKGFIKNIKEFIFKTIPEFFKKASKYIWGSIRDVFDKFVSLFDPITTFLNKITNVNVGSIVSDVRRRVSDMWEAISGAFKDSDMGKAFDKIAAGFKGVQKGIQQFIEDPAGWIKALFKGITESVKSLPNALIDGIKGTFDWIIAAFKVIGDLMGAALSRDFRKVAGIVTDFGGKVTQEREAISRETKEGPKYKAWKEKYPYGSPTYVQEQYKRDNPRPPENKEKGGPVASGQSYIVGEKGPEIYTPTDHGNITPNNEIKEMNNTLKKILAALESNQNGSPAPTFVPLMRSY